MSTTKKQRGKMFPYGAKIANLYFTGTVDGVALRSVLWDGREL
jgi:hypothetical protein